MQLLAWKRGELESPLLIGKRAALAARAIELLIEPLYLVIHEKVKCPRRRRAGEDPEQNLRLVNFQHIVRREKLAGRAAHLSGQTFESDKLVGLKDGRLVGKNFSGDPARNLVAPAGSRMVLAAGLEVDAFMAPAHRPIDFPRKLYVSGAVEINRPSIFA